MKPTLTLILFWLTTNCFSQDGMLDNTFGKNGRAIFPDTISSSSRVTMAVQEDGKTLLATRGLENGGKSIVIIRFNADGTSDSSFGENGKVATQLTQSISSSQDIILQKDRKIIVGCLAVNGNKDVDFALVRYDTNGSIDQNFGTGGMLFTDISGKDDYIYCLALQPDGKILAAGFHKMGSNYELLLTRFESNGMLDHTFNRTGIVRISTNAYLAGLNSVLIQDDHKIHVTGNVFLDGYSAEHVFMRFNSQGILDSSFGLNGTVRRNIENRHYVASRSVLQSDGKILTVSYGPVDCSYKTDFYVTRLNKNGLVDNTFGIMGVVKVPIDFFSDNGYAIAGTNNAILVGGTTSTSLCGNKQLTVIKLNNSTGIDYPDTDDNLRLFPNPSTINAIYIKTNKAVKAVKIYTSLGQLVKLLGQNIRRINLVGMSSGYYVVALLFENGEIAHLPFVKQ